MNHTSSAPAGYLEALERAAFFVEPKPGFLRIGGPDRETYLQRQTTNDVRMLASGRALETVLTSPSARILDVLTLLAAPEAIEALTLPGYGTATARFLHSRIFFNDNVTVEDLSASYAQVELSGPGTAALLQAIGAGAPEVGSVLETNVSGNQVRVIKGRGEAYTLLFSIEGLAAVREALFQAGAVEIPEEVREILRVEAGLPAARHELTEEYTPLETGLDSAVSGNKGCYTGQEVIARQITYGKVTKRLAGLRLEASEIRHRLPVAQNDSSFVNPGVRVYSIEDSRPAGEITSIARSPRFGEIALAVLKRPYDEPGTQVRIGEAGIAATVVPLPFVPDP